MSSTRKHQLSDIECNLLLKLKNGRLDGAVGTIMIYSGYLNVTCWKEIKNGVPVSCRKGKKLEIRQYITDQEKLEFIKRYGWLINDEEAREYSKTRE